MRPRRGGLKNGRLQSGWRQPTRPRDGGTNPIVLADASATAESGAKSKFAPHPKIGPKNVKKSTPKRGCFLILIILETLVGKFNVKKKA